MRTRAERGWKATPVFQDETFPIIGMGASAGGVEALSTLFRHLPSHLPAAFIVVTHLAPDRPSSLAEILGRCTPMSVTPAEDGALIQPGHVYLIPPGAILTVADGRLVLTDRVGERLPTGARSGLRPSSCPALEPTARWA